MSSAPESPPASESIETFSVPEVAAALGIRDRDVRSLLSERSLIGIRRAGAGPTIPAAFLMTDADGDTVVVPGLRGTVIQLLDSGYTEAEAVHWLFRANDELDATPVDALRELRTHAVRRAAQALAF